MIEFLTVFLGFFTGVHTVELDVGSRVTRVEVQLDGRHVGRLRGEPWSLACDFGSALEPHELEAIAFDGEDRELGRILQAVNFTRGVPQRGGSAEELTSVVIDVDRGARLPAPEEMGGWFISNGVPLTTVEVAGGSAEIMIVLEPTARPILHDLADSFLDLVTARVLQNTRKGQDAGIDDASRDRWVSLDPEQLPDLQALIVGGAQDNLREFARLDPNTGLRVMSPLAAPPSRVPAEGAVFRARRLSTEGGGFLWLAERASNSPLSLRLADSIAVAAKKVHGSGRPRAVVVILADDDREDSIYSPAQVRNYLDRLQVPLYVWSVVPNQRRMGWGEVVPVAPPPGNAGTEILKDRFWMAVESLGRSLDRQRVIWLAGSYLPQKVDLGSRARGIGMLGSHTVDKAEVAQR